jgi:hypothetical protein
MPHAVLIPAPHAPRPSQLAAVVWTALVAVLAQLALRQVASAAG